MAVALDHRDANASVMKFFFDLVHVGRVLEVKFEIIFFFVINFLHFDYNSTSE